MFSTFILGPDLYALNANFTPLPSRPSLHFLSIDPEYSSITPLLVQLINKSILIIRSVPSTIPPSSERTSITVVGGAVAVGGDGEVGVALAAAEWVEGFGD